MPGGVASSGSLDQLDAYPLGQHPPIPAGKFSTRDALLFGVRTLTENVGFFILVSLLLGVVSRAPALARLYVHNNVVRIVIDASDFILGFIVGVGLIKVALKFSRNEEAQMGDFLPSSPLVFRFLGASLLAMLGGMLAVMLFVFSVTTLFSLTYLFNRLLSPGPWWAIPAGAIGAVIACRLVWVSLSRRRHLYILWLILGIGVLLLVLILDLIPIRLPSTLWWDVSGAMAFVAVICIVSTALFFFAARLGVRLVGSQYFGHAMIDEGLRMRDAFRRSMSITRLARRELFLFNLLLLAAAGVVGALDNFASGSVAGSSPGHQAVSGPVWSVLMECVLLASWLLTWPFLVAHAFVYRRLTEQQDEVRQPSPVSWGSTSSATGSRIC